jgi:glutaredoxin 3
VRPATLSSVEAASAGKIARTVRVRLYTTRWCGYCVRAKALLEQRGIPYEEILLDDDPAFRQTIFDLTGNWTVPQIFIDDEPIGGYVELWRLDQTGKLAA